MRSLFSDLRKTFLQAFVYAGVGVGAISFALYFQSEASNFISHIAVFVIAAILFSWITFKLLRRKEKYLDQWGYVVLKTEDDFEHRHIAKQMLGRNLKPYEVVHHINGKRADNRVFNLCVMDREKHQLFHAWLRWMKEKNGKYPSFKEQNRTLVDEYDGILVGRLRAKKILNPTKTSPHVEFEKTQMSELLFEELRKARKRLADQRSVPAYVVCNDKILREMVDKLPETKEEMAQVMGIDTPSARTYGPYFVAVIKGTKSNLAKKYFRKDPA